MKHGSLFSGIGGFDLAAEWMEWDNVFHCEWNEFGQKVLEYYWPKAISYNDITKTDFSIHRGTIDILTGGFPCQPYSQAGKRLGKEDDRHLWPEMLRAIGEIQPRWVVGENVRGLTNWNGGLVFDEVQADLEAKGYKVTPFLLPAVAVNAPHRRDRIWFISRLVSNSGRYGQQFSEESKKERDLERNGFSFNEFNAFHGTGFIADTGSEQLQERTPFGDIEDSTQESTGLDNRIERSGDTWNVTNTERPGLEVKPCQQGNNGAKRPPFERNGNRWEVWPTQSPVCNGNDGLPSRLDGITFSKWRNESIKAGGNAIVPQVAYQIFKAIEEYEKTIR